MQDEVIEQVDGDKLVTSEGFKLVKDFLENEFTEEELYKMVRVWEEFDECARGSDSMDVFLSKFERSYNAAVASSKALRIPEEILAFMVPERSGDRLVKYKNFTVGVVVTGAKDEVAVVGEEGVVGSVMTNQSAEITRKMEK